MQFTSKCDARLVIFARGGFIRFVTELFSSTNIITKCVNEDLGRATSKKMNALSPLECLSYTYYLAAQYYKVWTVASRQ